MAEVSSYTSNSLVASAGKPYAKYGTVRANAALTTSFVASSHFDMGDCQSLNALFTLTYAANTSVTWYYEWSHDATTWYRSFNTSTSAGTNTCTANTNVMTISAASLNWSDGPVTKQARYVRVQVKGDSTDSCSIVIEGERY